MPTNVTLINDPTLIAKYKTNGLTYISDNNDIIPRDKAGNIIINADTSSNELLIIDPVTNIYTMDSALNVFDTTFNYFKFPVLNVSDITTDINIDTTNFESELLKQLINRRYTIPFYEYPDNVTQSDFRIPAINKPEWFNNVNPGSVESWGTWNIINFPVENEPRSGVFTITRGMIDSIQNSKNKIIQFEIALKFQSYATTLSGVTQGMINTATSQLLSYIQQQIFKIKSDKNYIKGLFPSNTIIPPNNILNQLIAGTATTSDSKINQLLTTIKTPVGQSTIMKPNNIYSRLRLTNGGPAWKSDTFPNTVAFKNKNNIDELGFTIKAGTRNQSELEGSYPGVVFKFNIDPNTMNEFDTYSIETLSEWETKLYGFDVTYWDIRVADDTGIYGITDLQIQND